jgi:hypothetical protein
MFVKANPRLGYMGSNAIVNAWNFWTGDFVAWKADPRNQAPLSARQIQDLANAAVRANGIDPNTNQPLAPQYAKSLPQDQAGLDSFVTQIKAKEISNIQRDYANNVQQLQDAQDAQDASNLFGSFPLGLVLAGGAVLVIGGALVIKAVK